MMRCSHCNGPLVFLGGLGRLAWFQCRHCGLRQSIPWEQLPDKEEETN